MIQKTPQPPTLEKLYDTNMHAHTHTHTHTHTPYTQKRYYIISRQVRLQIPRWLSKMLKYQKFRNQTKSNGLNHPEIFEIELEGSSPDPPCGCVYGKNCFIWEQFLDGAEGF